MCQVMIFVDEGVVVLQFNEEQCFLSVVEFFYVYV